MLSEHFWNIISGRIMRIGHTLCSFPVIDRRYQVQFGIDGV